MALTKVSRGLLSTGIVDNSNATAITIDSSENVGVGTSSPSYKADILATSQLALRLNTTDADGCFLAIQTNGTAKGYLGSSHHLVVGSPSENDITLRVENNLQFTTGGGTERMRINSSGKVGIGTSSPSGILSLQNGVNGTEAVPQFSVTGAVSSYTLSFFLDATAAYIGQNSAGRQLRLYSDTVGAGVVLTAGSTSFGTFSDERLKENIEPIENALESLSGLRTVKYHLKDVDGPEDKKKLGIIAQDLVGVIDEVIDPLQRSGDDTEYMAVRYTELVPVLIKAIQEQQAIIEALTTRITALENN